MKRSILIMTVSLLVLLLSCEYQQPAKGMGGLSTGINFSDEGTPDCGEKQFFDGVGCRDVECLPGDVCQKSKSGINYSGNCVGHMCNYPCAAADVPDAYCNLKDSTKPVCRTDSSPSVCVGCFNDTHCASKKLVCVSGQCVQCKGADAQNNNCLTALGYPEGTTCNASNFCVPPTTPGGGGGAGVTKCIEIGNSDDIWDKVDIPIGYPTAGWAKIMLDFEYLLSSTRIAWKKIRISIVDNASGTVNENYSKTIEVGSLMDSASSTEFTKTFIWEAIGGRGTSLRVEAMCGDPCDHNYRRFRVLSGYACY